MKSTIDAERHAAEDRPRSSKLESLALQFQAAKQLSVRGYDDGGQAHRDRTHTHGEIESPADEKAPATGMATKL